MKRSITIMAGLMVSLQAFAGANGSGGGMGVVCKDRDGSIKSVELLDLWESRVIYSRAPVNTPASVAELVEQNLQNLKNSLYAGDLCVGTGAGPEFCDGVRGPEALYKMLKFETDRFLTPGLPQVHRLKGAKLKRTNDAFEVVRPKDCKIEQLVRYKDTSYGGDILINQDLVDFMDETNEAALYVHEALYAFLRGYAEKSSLRVRRAVGLSFSGHRFHTLESFMPNQYYDCKSRSGSPGSQVFVYVPESGNCADRGAAFQVVKLAGMHALDFEEPSLCHIGKLDDVFGTAPLTSWQTLGSIKTGFDYSLYLSIGGKNGEKTARIALSEAPDQRATVETNLICELKTTP